MCEGQKGKGGSPVFRINMKGATVTVMFSESGMPGLKEKVRDILTESYGERLRDKVQALARQQ